MTDRVSESTIAIKTNRTLPCCGLVNPESKQKKVCARDPTSNYNRMLQITRPEYSDSVINTSRLSDRNSESSSLKISEGAAFKSLGFIAETAKRKENSIFFLRAERDRNSLVSSCLRATPICFIQSKPIPQDHPSIPTVLTLL